jgi:hypothetical protein
MADTDLRNDLEAAVSDHAVLGPPDEVIAKLTRLLSELPVDPFLMCPQWPIMSTDAAVATIRRLKREILLAINVIAAPVLTG